MLNQALQFILKTAFDLFVFALLLRFYMQLMRAPFRNPFSQFIVALTDFAVRPLRKIVPGLLGMDLASLLLAWVTKLALLVALSWLNDFPFQLAGGRAFLGFALLAAVGLLQTSLYLLIGVVFIQAVLSWVNPYNPLSAVLNSLSRPFTRFFQRFIPPVGGVDLSPLFIFVACQLLLMLPVAWLETLAASLL